MCLTRSSVWVAVILVMLGGCRKVNFGEVVAEACPVETRYGREHSLEVPVIVSPHQITYRVGDKLTISMYFSDSIYDISRDMHYKIEHFPFEPITLLYRIQGDTTWQSGYYLNDVLVDDRFTPRYNGQSSKAADMRGLTVYENGYYHFEYKLVMQTPGTYVTVITDQYNSNLIGRSELNAHADSIDFEGKCIYAAFNIASVIQHDAHYDEFLGSLIYLDKEVHRDYWHRIDKIDEESFGRGSGSFMEWLGIYCFEVVE